MRGLILALLMAAPAGAKPMTLKCTTSAGEATSDVVLDLASGGMTWGPRGKYKILRQTKRYLTAYLTALKGLDEEFAGEVWVLDRVSGEYNRAYVKLDKGTAWQTHPLSGRCEKPLP